MKTYKDFTNKLVENQEEHPELKKIKDEYESYEGKGTFHHTPHVHSDDNRVYKRGEELHKKYYDKKKELESAKKTNEEVNEASMVGQPFTPAELARLKAKEHKENNTKSVKEEVDTGEADARKAAPSSKEKQDKVFAQHRERMKKLRNETVSEGRRDLESFLHKDELPHSHVKAIIKKGKWTPSEGVKPKPGEHITLYNRDHLGRATTSHRLYVYPDADEHKGKVKIGPIKEAEQIDELSKGTLTSYIGKAAPSIGTKERVAKGMEILARKTTSAKKKKTYNASAKTWRDAAERRVAGIKTAADKLAREEVEMDEEFINGREYASHGLMHPQHAGSPMHKVTGNQVDFYAHGSGDKISGKVTMNNGKYVHIRANKSSGGALHKFKVTPHLPKEANEEVELEETFTYQQKLSSLNVVPKKIGKGRHFGADKDLSNDDHYNDTMKNAKKWGDENHPGGYKIIHTDHRGAVISSGSVNKVRSGMKNVKEEVEQIQELKTQTFVSYLSKAGANVNAHPENEQKRRPKMDKAFAKAVVRPDFQAAATKELRSRVKEEVEQIAEESLGDHAKLRSYADARGGRDKNDFHTAANHIEHGKVADLKRHLGNMDTDPRDKVLGHVNKAHWGKLGFKSMHEEVEQIDEISSKLAGNYLGAATKQHMDKVGVRPNMYDRIEKDMGKKRKVGVSRALDRILGNRKTNEEVDAEIKEATYSDDYDTVEKQDKTGKWRTRKVHRQEIVDKDAVKEEQEMNSFYDYLVELTDKQKQLDKNKNGKLDSQDFKMLRKEATSNTGDYESCSCDKCNKNTGSCANSMAAEEHVEEGYYKDIATKQAEDERLKKMKMKEDLDQKFPDQGSRVKVIGKVQHAGKKGKLVSSGKDGRFHVVDIGGKHHSFHGSDLKLVEDSEEGSDDHKKLSETLTDAQLNKREEVVKKMKKSYKGFKDRYGSRAKEVMYATATNIAKKSD